MNDPPRTPTNEVTPPAETSTRTRGFDVRRNVRLFNVCGFLAQFGPLGAIWVVYLTDYRDLSLAQVGLMDGVWWLTMIALEVPSGALADRFGRRLTFIAGNVIEGAGILVFALASNFPLLFLSYVLWAGGMSFKSGNDEAYLYEALAAGDRQAEYSDRYGFFSAMGTVASITGGLIGALVADRTNLQTGILIGVVPYLMTILVLLRMQEPPRAYVPSKRLGYLETLRGGLGAARRDRALRYVLLTSMAINGGVPLFFLLSQPFMSQHGVPLALFGVLITPVRLLETALSLVAGRVLRRLGLRAVLGLCVLALALGLSLLAAVDHVWAFAAFALPMTAFALSKPAVGQYVNARTSSEVRATVLSISPLGFAIMAFALSITLGVVGDRSLRLAFALGALALGGGAVSAYVAWLRADTASRAPVPSS